LSTHLQNVLVTVSDKKTLVDDGTYTYSTVTGYTKVNSTPDGKVDYYIPVIINANDYTPFGSLMTGRKYSAATSKYRYGFNGKENDNDVKGIEGSQQDYGMRIYDPRLGRFLSVDPITDEYPELTPYQFASNRPIDGIDLDGLEWVEAELAIVDGKPKLTIISNDKVSPIGLTYSDYTINIKYNANGQHYRFTTAALSGFASIFSSASGRENEFFPKFEVFFKDPVGTISSGYVTSIEQEFVGLVSEYGQLEMVLPSPARTAPGYRSSVTSEAQSGAVKPSTASATNKQATAVNAGNKEAATANKSASASFNYENNTYPIKATTPYKRPSNATTVAQRKAVNQTNAQCATCKTTKGPFVADHKTPLAVEHLSTGTVNKVQMRSLSAVQSQCKTCSSKQGGQLRQVTQKANKTIKNNTNDTSSQ
jgi:RHS repeat-associated protein